MLIQSEYAYFCHFLDCCIEKVMHILIESNPNATATTIQHQNDFNSHEIIMQTIDRQHSMSDFRNVALQIPSSHALSKSILWEKSMKMYYFFFRVFNILCCSGNRAHMWNILNFSTFTHYCNRFISNKQLDAIQQWYKCIAIEFYSDSLYGLATECRVDRRM